jgi:putative membrane protein
MIAHPLLIAARKITKNWVFLYGGLAMMAWDLFLDPQMVAAERWLWDFSGSHVPFQPEIPLSNMFGWLLTGMGLMGILNKFLFSGIVGNIFFFDRPGVALFGGVVFGLVLIPYVFVLRFGPPAND